MPILKGFTVLHRGVFCRFAQNTAHTLYAKNAKTACGTAAGCFDDNGLTQFYVPIIEILLKQTQVFVVDLAVTIGVGRLIVDGHVPIVEILLQQTQVFVVNLAVVIHVTGGELHDCHRAVLDTESDVIKALVIYPQDCRIR